MLRHTDDPIIIKESFRISVNKLWNALTEVDQMRQWFFENIPDFKPEVGFQTQFAVVNEGRTFTHLWTITEVVPDKKIVYNWKYKEYPGDSLAIFELSQENDQTLLRLTLKILEDFPAEIPEFSRESCIGGWNYFLGERLKEYLPDKS